EREVQYRMHVALGDLHKLARDLVDAQVDSMRQNTTMDVSVLSGRIDRLEGVQTFPDRMIKHVGEPDEAAIRGELEERRRQSRGRAVTGFQGGPLDRARAPLPSALHPEARLATAEDVGMQNG
ncbi:MAG: hypothetical protein ACREDY_03670, partial [Bradyrhizobium sp.]